MATEVTPYINNQGEEVIDEEEEVGVRVEDMNEREGGW